VIDVLGTLTRLGIEGRNAGREFIAQCPMHRERTGREDQNPSWNINTQTGLHMCFSCGYKGSLVSLIRDLHGDVADIEQAHEWLGRPSLPKHVTLPDLTKVIVGPRALDEALLGKFTAPPEWALTARQLTREACEIYGVLWAPYTDSWILPIRDPYTFGLMGWQEKSQTTRHFRNHPLGVKKSRTLFGLNAFTSGRMIVVESPLDAVRLYSEGITGGVAVFGAVVSAKQLMLLSRDEVVFALDNDDAGRKSCEQLLRETKGVLRSVRFFNYNGIGAKDIGDMSRDLIVQGIESARSRAHGIGVLA
jgi:hypothetical protein